MEQVELPTAGPFARLATQTASSPGLSTTRPGPVAKFSEEEEPLASTSGLAVEICKLNFSYPGIDGRPIPGVPPVVREMTASLPRGSRCLLVGPNGAGKTTLLKVLGGKHMVPPDAVRVLGRAPFHDTMLTASGALSYLGGNWDRDIAFAGYSIPLQGDFPVSKMLAGLVGVDPARKQRLLEAKKNEGDEVPLQAQVLDIDVEWRMHLVSDGQRRRVQLAMGLLRPFQVLLLDEITVDLDVLGRADLMEYLRSETEERGATIIYATHIFDGLGAWPTHLMYLGGGEVKAFGTVSEFPELRNGDLLGLVERWLRKEAAERKAAAKKRRDEGHESDGDAGQFEMAEWSNGWAAGRLTSTLKDASNAVMRM